MRSRPATIVISSAGRRPYIIEWFRAAFDSLGVDGRIVVAENDATSAASSFGDMTRLMPAYSDPDYGDEILSLLDEFEPALFFSANDYELMHLHVHTGLADTLRDRGVVVPGVSAAWQRGCADKLRMAGMLDAVGIPTPPTVRGSDRDGIAELRADAEEFVIKHRFGSRSSGLAVVPDWQLEDAVRFAAKSVPPREGRGHDRDDVVVQPKLAGTEYGVDIVGSLREEGRFAAVLARRKLRMRAGETDKAVTVDPGPFLEVGEAIAGAAQLSGLIDLDMFLDSAGRVSVIDINPRFGGGYPFVHLAGADVPRYYLAQILGLEIDDAWKRYDVGVVAAKHQETRVTARGVRNQSMTLSEGPAAIDPDTPAFVIDVPALDGLLCRFREALDAHWPNSVLSYSVKTNPLPWLLAHMRSRGVWAEVVSDSEYELARALGHEPDRIVYNGPVKSREKLRTALRGGSLTNLDAKREVRWTAELAAEEPGLDLRVGLRVNWDLETRCPGESTIGVGDSRFGFDVDSGELAAVISELTESGVRIAGLHMHRNSRTKSLDVYRAAARVAAEIVAALGLDPDWIDIGGGFYGNPSDESLFDDYISSIRSELEGTVDPERTRLVIEPGGSLIAAPVEFHAQVLDVKDVGHQRFVITDVSRTDIDPLFRKRTAYDIRIDTAATEAHSEQVICGFTCMEDDRLMALPDSPALEEGDRIVFRRVGAYTMSYGSSFIEFPPAVYVRHEDSLALVRRRWGVDDFLQGNVWDSGDRTGDGTGAPREQEPARRSSTGP